MVNNTSPKIAVCVSGLLAGNYIARNNSVLKRKFPTADFYYATWKGNEDKFYSIFPNDQCFFFDEPEIDYHPLFIETFKIKQYLKEQRIAYKNKVVIESTKHRTKQILIHGRLIQSLPKEYDIIVRVRFDSFVIDKPNVDFSPLILHSYRNNHTHGICSRGYTDFSRIEIINAANTPYAYVFEIWLNDEMIIHPQAAFDVDKMNELHYNKQLPHAEYGWHIMLPNRTNWYGWVAIDRNVAPHILEEEGLYEKFNLPILGR